MMADKTETPPKSISAFRLLYIYMLLCQHGQMTGEELIDKLHRQLDIRQTYTSETFQKYLQTLRRFGCRISRIDKHGKTLYRLEDHPLKNPSLPTEIKALQAVSTILRAQPIWDLYQRFCQLCDNLTTWNEISTPVVPNFSEEIELFKQYCRDGQLLEIYYKNQQANPVMLKVEPIEVVAGKKRVYLSGTDLQSNKKIRCDLSQIYSHKQLPSRIRSQAQKIVVTFRLTGKLVNNYRLYPGETIISREPDLIVQHKTDEVDQLLRRLLKYGTQCEVLTPDCVRQEMCTRIDALQEAFNTEQIDGNLQKWLYHLCSPQTSDDARVD